MTENLVLQSMHLLAGVLTHKVMTKVLQAARDTMDEETRVRLAEMWLEELRALGGVPLGRKRPRASSDGGDGDGNGSTRAGVRRRLRSDEDATAAKEASRHSMLRDKVTSIQHHRGCMGVPEAVMAPPMARRSTATGLFQSEVVVKLAHHVSADTTTTTTTTATADTNTNTSAEAAAARSSSEVGTGTPPTGISDPTVATRPRRVPVQGHHLLGAQVDMDVEDPDPARRYARIVKMTAGYRKIPAMVRVRFLDGSDMQLPWGGPHSARLTHEQSADWEALVRRSKGLQEQELETESDAGGGGGARGLGWEWGGEGCSQQGR